MKTDLFLTQHPDFARPQCGASVYLPLQHQGEKDIFVFCQNPPHRGHHCYVAADDRARPIRITWDPDPE